MNRSLTQGELILSRLGNPATGRVYVYRYGTGQLAVLRDESGTQLPNPVDVSEGRTQSQVFLPQHDCKCELKKLVDQARPELPESWALVRSWVAPLDAPDIDVESTGVYAVASIAALKSLDVSDVPEFERVKVVELLGFASAGDKPPVLYRWSPTSTATSNDADIVAPGPGAGRWIMQRPYGQCDCRHFGLFPRESYDAQGMAEDFAFAAQRCAYYGVKMELHAVNGGIYYRCDSRTVNGVRADRTVRIMAKDDTSAVLEDCDAVCASATGYSGTIRVIGPVVRTSQAEGANVSLEPYSELVVDTAFAHELHVSNVSVSVVGEGSALKNTASSLDGCFFTNKIFDSVATAKAVASNSSGSVTDVSAWDGAGDYMAVAYALGMRSLDLGGKTADGFSEHGVGETLTIDNGTVTRLDYSGRLFLRGVTAAIGATRTPSSVDAEGCDISGLFEELTARGCDITGDSVVYGRLDLDGCTVSGDVEQMDVDGVYSGRISGCTFTGGAKHVFTSASSAEEGSLVVKFRWSGNVGLSFNVDSVKVTGDSFADDGHDAVYEDNGDGFTSRMQTADITPFCSHIGNNVVDTTFQLNYFGFGSMIVVADISMRFGDVFGDDRGYVQSAEAGVIKATGRTELHYNDVQLILPVSPALATINRVMARTFEPLRESAET